MNNTIDITQLLIAVLTILAGIATRYLVPFIKSKLNAEQLNTVKEWVKIAVQAAEMIYKESGMGQKKKEAVIEFLKEKNITVDDEEIDKLIESAVLELNNK